MIYIEPNISIHKLQEYLISKKWLSPNEQIQTIEKPGEGNMNVVLRIMTNERSFIAKQSRPFVQKYQQIKAPIDRITVENQFYEIVQNKTLDTHMPKILGYDHTSYVLLLEDLGHCEDMTAIYQKRRISSSQLEKLTSIASAIHQSKVPNDFPDNLEMRKLNHQHIFVLPFLENNGFQLDDLQKGLQQLSIPYKSNEAINKVVHEIGEKYLAKGNTLLHGDYYPGSWMTETNHLYVIDPEFGFAGFAEFDLGVMAAHCIMATHSIDCLNTIYTTYTGKVDKRLMTQVAGIEIMRRLIGLAQLPLERSIKEKEDLLQMAYKMILE